MRATLLIVGLAVVLGLGSLWAFFAQGVSTNESPVVSADIIKIADSRLSQGNADAAVKIVEYTDILCPFCAKVHEEVLPKIQADYIDRGTVHYEMRIVAKVAPDSQRAGEGAYCAAEQGKFWEYIGSAYERSWDNYYSKDKSPTDVPLFSQSNIRSFARDLSLDMFDWDRCMESGKYKKVILDNQDKMKEIDAFGTPHFIINNTNYSGAPPYAVFKGVIDADLRKAGEQQ